jgi:LysM repeat protein
MLICSECGARQRRRGRTVRCAHCGGRASVELVVCPHCGRNLRPAGPRWALLLAALLLVVLAGLWALGRLPIEQVQQEIAFTRARLAGLVQIHTANFPVVELPTPESVAGLVSPAPQSPTPSPTRPPTGTPSPTRSPMTVTVSTPAATPTRAATGTPATATLTATALSATATLTRPAAASPTGTATSAVAGTKYRLQAGDSLASIGERFDIPWETIAAANGLTAESLLLPGQELIIPAPGATVSPVATPRPRPTATPAPPTATATPALPAPVLLNPGDGSPFSGEKETIVLEWQAVGGLPAGAEYQITIHYQTNGATQSHIWRTPLTSTRVPLWLWNKADQPGRRYTWFVTVVQVTTDGKGGERIVPLSPPSQLRTFSWT